MGPIQFIFTACFLAAPDVCHRIDGPVFSSGFGPSACVREGPAITNAWARRNPDWLVAEWTCLPVGQKA